MRGAAALQMGFVVVAAGGKRAQNKLCRFIADGAVRGHRDDAGGFFNQVECAVVGVAGKQSFQQIVQLAEADPAGRAFAAGLAVAKIDERAGHIHRANADWIGLQPAAEIGIERINHTLRTCRGWDG